jgi:elongation factor Ts
MSVITAKDVNDLRQKTGAGMMDCKKALTEANGNMEEAIDLLRKQGQKVAAKRGDREASEGLVLAKSSADGKKGYLICVNCETDFVAKNADFVAMANGFLDAAIANDATSKDAVLSLPYGGITIGEKIMSKQVLSVRKLKFAFEVIEAAEKVVAYNHPGNQIASIVGLTADEEDAGRQIAMQIAAMAPIAVDEKSVPARRNCQRT